MRNPIIVLCLWTALIIQPSFPATAGAVTRASESVWVRENAQGSTDYITSHAEGGAWVVDFFVVQPRSLQKHVKQRKFLSLHAAEAYLRSRVVGFKKQSDTELTREVPLQESMPEVDLLPQSLWEIRASWDLEWERKYSDWVEKTITPLFYKNNGVGTDCADVVIAARWIFARIHGLPALSQLAATGMPFSHAVFPKEWESLPTDPLWSKDRRFMRALNYVLSNTYTHSLLRDSYSIAIRKETIVPGTHHLELDDSSGHALMIQSTDRAAAGPVAKPPMLMIFSGVPREVRKIWTSGYWQPYSPKPQSGGFLRLRWPENRDGKWQLRAAKQMPSYSLEQYEPSFIAGRLGFWEAVILRANPQPDYAGLLRQALKDLEEQLYNRDIIVKNGYAVCQTQNCAEGTSNYYNLGTPTRDRRLGNLVQVVEGLAKNGGAATRTILTQSQARILFSIDGSEYTLGAIMRIWNRKGFSSDPRMHPKVRWGNPENIE